MKRFYKIYMLSLLLIVFSSAVFAQITKEEEQYTADQLREIINREKQDIRAAAKQFLIDELPDIVKKDPSEANRALEAHSSMFTFLKDEEMTYLLGHFYARVGDNDKAISSFDALLRSSLNEDARKMLNLVLYRKLIEILDRGDRKAARDFLKLIVFANYNVENYFPTYLYIWSDLSSDTGNYEDVLALIQAYNDNRDLVLNRILPIKQIVLQRLDKLDLAPFFANPSSVNKQALVKEIEQVKIDLTALYNEIVSLKGMTAVNLVVDLHKNEITQLDSLNKLVSDYADTTTQIEIKIRPALEYIEATKQSIAQYNYVLKMIDTMMQDKYKKYLNQEAIPQESDKGNLELARIMELEQNIQEWQALIDEIDKLIASGNYNDHLVALNAERTQAVEKVADFTVRKQKYTADMKYVTTEEEEVFKGIVAEYHTLVAEKKEMELSLAELEEFVRTEARTIVNDDLQNALRPQISNELNSARNSRDRDIPVISSIQDSIVNIEFVSLQLSYRDLYAQQKALALEKSNSSNPNASAKHEELRQKKATLISDMKSFLSNNSSKISLEQPGGGFVAGAADMYYNLAEMQFDVEREDLRPSLESFRKVVELDPNHPNKDAALYNIAFISSELKRIDIANALDLYLQRTSNSGDRPNSTRFLERDFVEALSCYNEIITNYPESKFFDESIYRLGLLNFQFAGDSENPKRYYDLAVNYFDQLANKPSGSFKYDAIYHRGWVRLNSNEENDLRLAMSDFLTLLNAIESGLIKDPLLANDYKDDAIENIAFCLIALDGTDFRSRSRGVTELQNIFSGYKNDEVIRRVVDQATINKFDLAATIQAIDYIQLKINLSPLALENPVLLDSILTLYYSDRNQIREGDDIDQIRYNIYSTMIKDYNHNSAWYAANKDKSVARQIALVDNAYTQLGVRLHNNFTTQPSQEKLSAYISHMADFDGFKRLHGENYAQWKLDVDRSTTAFYTYLADQQRNETAYMQAITNLYLFNEKYPDDSDVFNNEGLALGYAQSIFDMMNTKFDQGGYIPEQGLPANQDAVFEYFSKIALRFIDVSTSDRFVNDANQTRALQITLFLGDILMAKEKLNSAKDYYLKALAYENKLSNIIKRDTFLKLADIEVKLNNYRFAEDWYRKALPLALDANDRNAINTDIRVQIQSNFEAAANRGDFALEATERLRLAAEFSPSESNRVLGQKYAAHQAYIKAKDYQKAIDLLIELASSESNVDIIYTRYNEAWKVASADSLMNDQTVAAAIEQQFIDRYPASNQAFGLRLNRIVALEKDPTKYTEAAEAYLTLHNEAKAGRIDKGDVIPSDLFEEAIRLYNLSGNKIKEFELRNQFIAQYPNHPRVIPYLELMAKEYFDQQDMPKYEELAKEIFKRDKSKSSYYQYVANKKLELISTDFDTAYRNKDYPTAFKARDEFKRVEAAFIKEGLSFSTAQTYTFFAQVQEEYDNIQKRLAYFKSYDSQLAALERSDFLTKRPDQHIAVNVNTTWDNHLAGGKNNRLLAFSNTVKVEVNKITKLIQQANNSGYDLDNERVLRANHLLSRYYDKAEDVVKAQITQYFRTSSEADPYRKQLSAEQLSNTIANVVSQFSSAYVNESYRINYGMYTHYHVAGYSDRYTAAAKTKLEQWNMIPDFKIEEYPLNTQWQASLQAGGTKPTITSSRSPKGLELGTTNIPANNSYTVNRQVDARIIPDFAMLHVMYPFDVEIKLNGLLVEAGWVPIDTLTAGKPASTRYAIYIPGASFAEGQNNLEIQYPNPTATEQAIAMNFQMFTSKQRLKESIPPQIVKIYTDQGWKYIVQDQGSNEEKASYASLATNFGITWDNIQDIEPNASRAIWIPESAQRIENLIFETEFALDTEFVNGSIDLVAPESTTILLNGSVLAEDIIFDYDAEPLAIYPSQISINKDLVKQGKNILRFVVNNPTQFRGFLATVTITKTGKEDIR